MAGDSNYDLIVIGAGLCGSAAAKHALELCPSLKVLLLGPEEEDAEAAATAWGPGRIRCHADEGRITRRLDPDPTWAALASRSIDRYAALEAEVGETFHRATGFLALGTLGCSYIERTAATAKAAGIFDGGCGEDKVEELSGEQLRERFPALDFAALVCSAGGASGQISGILEPSLADGGHTGAGIFSARALVRAQQLAFERRGGKRLAFAAEAVAPALPDANASNGSSQGLGWQEVRTDRSTVLRARRVLVATNAATNMRPLLPRRLDLTLRTQSTARFALSEEDAARLQNMPAVVCEVAQVATANGEVAAGGAEVPAMDHCYVLPPVFYPGGEGWSVKLGHGKVFEQTLHSEAQAAGWYTWTASGDSQAAVAAATAAAKAAGSDSEAAVAAVVAADAADAVCRKTLVAALGQLLPGVEPRQIIYDRCATANTAHKHPYIDILFPQEVATGSSAAGDGDAGDAAGIGGAAPASTGYGTVVACCVGCCGFAGKSSDEVGRLAARRVLFAAVPGSAPWYVESADWADGLDPAAFRAVFKRQPTHDRPAPLCRL